MVNVRKEPQCQHKFVRKDTFSKALKCRAGWMPTVQPSASERLLDAFNDSKKDKPFFLTFYTMTSFKWRVHGRERVLDRDCLVLKRALVFELTVEHGLLLRFVSVCLCVSCALPLRPQVSRIPVNGCWQCRYLCWCFMSRSTAMSCALHPCLARRSFGTRSRRGGQRSWTFWQSPVSVWCEWLMVSGPRWAAI